tara:strand:+ start:322 stop:492 length:171 start_codon:yes stop_codon:yes gene_type:complete
MLYLQVSVHHFLLNFLEGDLREEYFLHHQKPLQKQYPDLHHHLILQHLLFVHHQWM